MNAFNKNEISNKLSTILFNLSILIFIIGFGFRDTPTPFGWYQQFIPYLNNQPLQDITFLDSLTGYAITQQYYVLKTTNRGDNWNIIYIDTAFDHGFQRIEFINQNTGFVGGGMYFSGTFHLLKTTNSGNNWFYISTPVTQVDMYVLNEDTIWIVDNGGFGGGIFRTTNGGLSWDVQYSSTVNPNKIYMYNSRIGFACTGNLMLKTTNSGQNWNQIGISSQSNAFSDMYFIDSLTGWKSNLPASDTNMVKTTNGGLNWDYQRLPHGGLIPISSGMYKFSKISRDTLFGTGGGLRFNSSTFRGIIWITTNGGGNWYFQLPDTAFGVPVYTTMNFINNKIGWSYSNGNGIHTTTGGDTILYISIKKISSIQPKQYILFQNYPNPFNPNTVIEYSLKIAGYVNLKVYDISGKFIVDLVNKKQSTGNYEIQFNGSKFSSGVYFYSLYADGNLIDTKRMVLLK